MSLELALPSVVLMGIVVALGLARWPLPEAPAIKALTTIAVITATTACVVIMAAGFGYVLGPARQAELVEWCRVIPIGHEVGHIEGVVSLMALAVIATRVWSVVRSHWMATKGTTGRRFSIIETSEPIAYAAPGKPGCVVVSTGLLSALEPKERQVVFAHERAHLRQAHHRYLFLGALSQAVVPLLQPLNDRLRLATERCADEEAVVALGGDRRLVASAVAKAAITMSSSLGVVPAFNGASVLARVNALIGPPPNRRSITVGVVVGLVGTVLTVGASLVQFHHLWAVVDHVCRG